MELKKSSKADLEGKKGIFFEIGLIIALAMVLSVFEWKSYAGDGITIVPMIADIYIEAKLIPITHQMLKSTSPLPPLPQLTNLIDIVEDDIDIDEELEILDAEDESEDKELQELSDFGEYDAEHTGEQDVFDLIEAPQFPGGNHKIPEWFDKKIKRSVLAMKNRIRGEILVEFVVGSDGSVVDVKILRGANSPLNKKIVRIVEAMPRWKPGKLNGKLVSCIYTMPVTFNVAQ